jgi:hypothetical protein
MNFTYITNALWAGSFGSFHVNIGTESVWNQDTLLDINFKGLEGLEANNARALAVHRQVINKAVIDSLGIHPLGMTPQEMAYLTEFLANGLFDPSMDRYIPAFVMSGNCFPDNDILSRIEMGCN